MEKIAVFPPERIFSQTIFETFAMWRINGKIYDIILS